MDFRYHPVIEGLKCNEDGSIIILNGKELVQKKYNRKDTKGAQHLVHFFTKNHSVIRLICECWIGMSENYDYIPRRVDESKGNHYSNLFWSKRGQELNPNFRKPLKLSKEKYFQIKAQIAESGMKVMDFLKVSKETSSVSYYNAKREYEKKPNR